MKTLSYLMIVNALFSIASIGFAAENTTVESEQSIDIDTLLISQKEILFKEDDSLSVTFRVRENHPKRKAIDFLEQNGSPQAIKILKDFLTNHGSERKLKLLALLALGRIGTDEAIDAITKFEKWSRARFLKPQPFCFGRKQHASDHFQDYYVDPVAKTTDSQGKTWAIFPRGQRILLTSSDDGETWTQPITLDLTEMPRLVRTTDRTFNKKFQLKIDNDTVIITCDEQVLETSIKASLKDSDSDGLPDIVEAQLQTDPTVSDTDKDGVADGRDSNPLTPRHSENSDETQIRQAVFAALFATCSNTDAIALIDRGEFARQEYYGFAGTVLRVSETRSGFVNITGLTVKLESPTTATASIHDWGGMLAASTHEAKLKKINGKWIIVEFMLTMIS